MTPEPTFYELLGIEQDATQAEVKSAFRQQAKRNHPDQGGNPTLFRMIENAYETLVDARSRADYDASLRNESSYASTTQTQSWDSPPYQEPFENGYDDANYAEYGPEFSNQEPQGQPIFTTGPRSVWAGHAFRAAYAAMLVWVVVAVVIGVPVVPGLPNDATLSVVIAGILAWIFGSFLLRVFGWFLLAYALVQAHWFDADPTVTLGRIAIAFSIWLCGQWLFTFKHGDWRSIVAHSLLTKLPMIMRPDRRWLVDDIY